MEKIYFVGINGIGMSGLAKIMKCQGYDVVGADLARNYVTEELESLGITVYPEHKACQMQGRDSLIASSAIHSDNPEFQYAKQHNIPLMKRGELLATLLNNKVGIAVAGTHGKTTTSSMMSAVMLSLDPTIVVGGILPEIGSNAKVGMGEYFIAEADESDNSFLFMKPKYAVVTNIEEDHLETHGNLENIEKSFRQFVEQTERKVLVCTDCANVRTVFSESEKIMTYGMDYEANIMAKNVEIVNGKTSFEVLIQGESQGRFYISIPGKHNILNSLPVIYFSLLFGVPKEEIQDKLLHFRGSKRRYDVLYWDQENNRKIIDDYAHHPTEIQATLKGVKSIEKGKIIGIFQPHRYSRVHFLLERFAHCFEGLDELILLPIYSAGEQNESGVSEKDIAKIIPTIPVTCIESKERVVERIMEETREDNHIFIFMGAGDISKLAHEVADRLQK
ncbi:UDP-N-acetylmuramate--L-alanine ligase [Fusobacterium gonidiaformans 3-1-5R]|uniref:UDP-N-acetylmuramate--L-alanine ligase n=1 Tax=Fusobacterium gonidiaformans 3-1-5R TaxID=469605 RepID=E5BHM2_9FUSO|nr:UDP-N-acetylmuramate--L-alanine ligase [Fusobacterium gonidiaformans]EFS21995.1 UDP-N-acetylmuramate--L-alanine ligase [Fusobacterium gonidiaformans 3-1-5R]